MSLAEKIALLANPTPVFQDPEDVEDGTTAKLISKDTDALEDIDVSSTALRRKAAPLLDEEDRRYAGKAVSRKALSQFSDEEEFASEIESSGNEEPMHESESDSDSVADDDDDDGDGDDIGDDDDDDEEENDLESFRKQFEKKAKHVIENKKKGPQNIADKVRCSSESESSSMKGDSDKVDESYEEQSDNKDEIEEDGSEEEQESETESGEEETETEEEIDLEAFKKQLKNKPRTTDSFTFEDDGDYSKYADLGESESESDGENESDEEESESEEEMEEDIQSRTKKHSPDDEDGGVLNFSSAAVSEEVAKGQAARSQLSIWDSLLEGRIRMQKCLSVVNQLPQHDTCHQFMAKGGQPLRSAVTDSKTALKKLLDKLAELQSLLLLQYPQTQKMLGDSHEKISSSKQTDSDDEEITSEEEGVTKPTFNDDADEKEEQLEKMRQDLKRKRAFKDYPDFLAKRHKSFEPFRDTTIQKWHDKTRIASGKINKGFSSFEQSALKQIKHILGDRNRLIERTRAKRASYDVLGKSKPKPENEAKDEEEEEDSEQNAELQGSTGREDDTNYDAEIFDDSDFYHQLLRELIERKTANVKDPMELSRQWIQMQTLRTKPKRKVDPRATKGRKVRYDIHPKLVNFMGPVDACQWTEESRNDLFSSLFGNRNKVEEKIESSVNR